MTGRDSVKPLRSSYTGLYPQRVRVEGLGVGVYGLGLHALHFCLLAWNRSKQLSVDGVLGVGCAHDELMYGKEIDGTSPWNSNPLFVDRVLGAAQILTLAPTEAAVERIWHIQDSQGQILALALRQKS